MIEIAASTKVRGKRWVASVEAAKRKVRDGEIYLIRRHGGYFRPGAHGYTTEISAAGIFPGTVARGYLDVAGLSVVPLWSMRKAIEEKIAEANQAVANMQDMLFFASAA